MASKTPCQHLGCSGMVEDGFCLSCGLEPAPINLPAAHPAPSATTMTSRGTMAGTSAFTTAATGRGTTRTGTRGTRGSRSSSRVTSRRMLGLGLVQIPELPALDPASVIMANPSVPEAKRYCPQCEQKLTREKGFCPKCGKSYSFIPSLAPGDLVNDQYEVLGAMAFGGLGWIYLAKDKTLSRWVVLKGLLNAKDASSAAVAVAERQFLAAVKHPNIVGVYNFVERGTEGYIVMEFVRGKTLRDIRKERGPLPVAEAIAYIHRVLGAFAYLHRQDPPLIYCDFKPENVMLEGDDVKLIDLGAVRQEDDPGGEVYGTKGYSAPEGGEHPSISSDLFSLARSLAVLVCDFRSFQSKYEFTLPPPDEQPVFVQYDSLYRFLLKATAHDPLQRFDTADEMAEQLGGVLREIVAMETGNTRPFESVLFGGDPQVSTLPARASSALEAVKRIPSLKLDTTDPGANYLLMNAGAADVAKAYSDAMIKFPESVEARLRLARARTEASRFNDAEAVLGGLCMGTTPLLEANDWRILWHRGINLLAQERYSDAEALFDGVCTQLPGETTPKLALAITLEMRDSYAKAANLYERVSRTDQSAIGALFGLARCYNLLNEYDKAAETYGRVPATSTFYPSAQIALARIWLLSAAEDQITKAASTVEALALEGRDRYRIAAEVLYRALYVARMPGKTVGHLQVFGHSMDADSLQFALEDNLRSLARLTKDPDERIRLVDLANQVRPLTLI